MSNITTIELKNIHSEDIGDVLIKVERSFGFKFGKTELKDVKTFGELCDIIADKVSGYNLNDCTTQQAFYKIRDAITITLLIDKTNITNDTELKTLFSRQNRRQKIATMEGLFGFKIRILRPKYWITVTFALTFLASLVGLFISWKIGLAILIFSIAGINLATKFGNELDLNTVGQLAEKISRENYLKSRRSPSTVNRAEIDKKVKELFITDLDLGENVLTRQATFV
ncbi:MAG TPA: hypothetical protein VK483_16865 [Chitinophagaceae bacterium]|nr:hypothetical protein [Chitinophagaceae bacterium]